MSTPVICFGQQPCGFFPKRFLVAKIRTARRLQSEIGGEIVFFFHDSDHDPRETKTLLRHRKTSAPAQLNFAFENRVQRKFSPLYLKRIPAGWQDKTALQLPNYVSHDLIAAFQQTDAVNAADFCLELYRRMGLLEGIRVVRSSDPAFRRTACDVAEFFVDVPHEGEIVRARFIPEDGRADLPVGLDARPSLLQNPAAFLPRPVTQERGEDRGEGNSEPKRTSSPRPSPPLHGGEGDKSGANQCVRAGLGGKLILHEGGDAYVTLPPADFGKEQISPARDARLRWMQSILRCTHYVAGAGEQAYLRRDDAPEIQFVNRDPIDRSDEAYTEIPA
jgi:hypothetical protein